MVSVLSLNGGKKVATTNLILTARQKEIMRAVAKGCTDAQIAVDLCISIWTVRSHLAEIFSHLDARNRAHAVARFLALELCQVPLNDLFF